jgi:uncharacterized protein with NRDE domain
MCLINIQLHAHPDYPLIVAANRDEDYDRPTVSADFWVDEPGILAGRDLLQFGTWLGITKQGRFAALTNFRDPKHMKPGKVSRGSIVREYLTQDVSPEAFMHSLKKKRDNYTGFNLIAGSRDQLFHFNNVQNEITKLTPGTHGLSNDTLNTPWPKVIKGKSLLNSYVTRTDEIQAADLFEILSDTDVAKDEKLPDTGIALSLERKLSPLFIKTSQYGTRSSTVLLIDNDNHVTFVERTYDHGKFSRENKYSFQIGGKD